MVRGRAHLAVPLLVVEHVLLLDAVLLYLVGLLLQLLDVQPQLHILVLGALAASLGVASHPLEPVRVHAVHGAARLLRVKLGHRASVVLRVAVGVKAAAVLKIGGLEVVNMAIDVLGGVEHLALGRKGRLLCQAAEQRGVEC